MKDRLTDWSNYSDDEDIEEEEITQGNGSMKKEEKASNKYLNVNLQFKYDCDFSSALDFSHVIFLQCIILIIRKIVVLESVMYK